MARSKKMFSFVSAPTSAEAIEVRIPDVYILIKKFSFDTFLTFIFVLYRNTGVNTNILQSKPNAFILFTVHNY